MSERIGETARRDFRLTVQSSTFSLLLCALSAFAQKPAALPPGVVAQGDHYVSQSDGVGLGDVPYRNSVPPVRR